MPVRPLQTMRPAAKSFRIEPGAIVEYEQHGKPALAVVLSDKKGRWALLNQQGQEVTLEPARLYLLPEKVPPKITTTPERTAYLTNFEKKALELQATLQLETAWEIFSKNSKEISVEELCEVLCNGTQALQLLAVRRALLDDRVFFKRRKNGFEARPAEVVEELKLQMVREEQKARARKELVEGLIARVQGRDATLPSNVGFVAELAALGSRAEGAKEYAEVVAEVAKRTGIPEMRTEERAFEVLVRAKVFSPHENLELIRADRYPQFHPDVVKEAKALPSEGQTAGNVLDLTALETFTIDSAETLDVDDALSLERTASGYRLGVHISEVVWAIARGSLLEREVFRRATSIYTPDQQISMLPHELSHDRVSLVAGKARRTMSFLFELDSNFEIRSRAIHRAVIKVKDRLTYEEVDALLFNDSKSPSRFSDAFGDQLLTLWQITSALEQRRSSRGAITFGRREMIPKLNENGTVSIEEANEDTPGRKLVSELMVLANETAAAFARDRGIEIVFRSQEPPEKDLETVGLEIQNDIAREYFRRSYLKRSMIGTKPLAHFGLGLEAYTQATSPIRRAFDFINQRQIAHTLDTGEPFYKLGEIAELMAEIEANLDEATFIQRDRNRYWLLQYLVQEKFTTLEGTVVKIDGPKPLAELAPINILHPFVPASAGNGPRPEKRLGDPVRFKIDEINPRRGILRLSEIS